jgi:hypothetical protein
MTTDPLPDDLLARAIVKAELAWHRNPLIGRTSQPEHARRMEAAVRAVLEVAYTGREREDAWQPIETAPKDNPAPHWTPAHWLLLGNQHHAGVGRWYEDDYDQQWVDEHLEPIEPPPTHWMPLPDPPMITAEQ